MDTVFIKIGGSAITDINKEGTAKKRRDKTFIKRNKTLFR